MFPGLGVDRGEVPRYTFKVTTEQGKRGGRGQKTRAAKAPRKAPWGGLAAAIVAVLGLGVLLYSSWKGESLQATAEQETKQEGKGESKKETPPLPGVTAITTATAPAAHARDSHEEGWNDAQIAWQSYEAGMAQAKANHKPVLLVFYTAWCGHCRNYSRVFQDPRIVARARDFVMVRVNPDDEPAVGDRYAPDGAYVPRTFFLTSEGALMGDVHAPRPRFRHFFDEDDPTSLLGGMEAALRKAAQPM